jgi:hypothetical protein
VNQGKSGLFSPTHGLGVRDKPNLLRHGQRWRGNGMSIPILMMVNCHDKAHIS